MTSVTNVTITQVTWQQAEAHLRAIRTNVFIEEQLVPAELEWDDMDKKAVHVLVMCTGEPIACLRILDYSKIGRMAVIKHWRGKNIGSALLAKAISLCELNGSQHIDISAQTHAVAFYQRAGFKVVSDEYDDVNIPHVDMRLHLKN